MTTSVCGAFGGCPCEKHLTAREDRSAGDAAEAAAASCGGVPALPPDLEAAEIAAEAGHGDAGAVAEPTLGDWLATVLGALGG